MRILLALQPAVINCYLYCMAAHFVPVKWCYFTPCKRCSEMSAIKFKWFYSDLLRVWYILPTQSHHFIPFNKSRNQNSNGKLSQMKGTLKWCDLEEVVGERGVEVGSSSDGGGGDEGCLEVNSRCQRKGRLLLRFLQSEVSGNWRRSRGASENAATLHCYI